MVDVYKIDKFFNENKLITESGGNKISTRAKVLRAAKLIMPSLAAVIIGIIMVYPSLKEEAVIIKNDITIPKEGELEKLHIEKTVFSITNEQNQISVITADSIDEVEAGSNVVKIINPKGNFPISKKGDMIDLYAKTGFYNQTDSHIRVEQNVKAVYEDGSTIVTQSGEYDFKTGYGHGNEPVYAFGNWGKMWADGFEYHQNTNLLVLTGNSKVINQGRELISNRQLRYYRLENRLEAEGNVKVISQDNILHADLIKTYLISGKNLEVEKIEAFGNVKIITKDGIAKGDYALYNPLTAEVELINNVSIEKDGNIIYGQKALTNLKTSISKIIANPKSKNRVSGIIKGSTIKR